MLTKSNIFYQWVSRKTSSLLLVVLLGVSYLYRINGLTQNDSFWTDEEHVAIFVRAILERGKPILVNGYTTGYFQLLQYWVSALSAKIFGLNEFALRFPSVIFGVLTVWATYFLGNKLFNKKVGLIAAFFITFLRIEILWSRQARPYQALQLLFLIGAYFIYRLVKTSKPDLKTFTALAATGIVATLFHGLGLIYFLVLFVNLVFQKPAWFRLKWLTIGLLAVPLVVGSFKIYLFAIAENLGKINNLNFYRVFLWYNYQLFVFLALIGVIFLVNKKNRVWFLLTSYLISMFLIASYFLNQPFTRYLYPVFPFLVLLASYGLWQVVEFLKTSNFVKTITVWILVFFIAGMGWKFAITPKPYYPLNEDMQEIPQVNWKAIYGFVGDKINANPGAILVSNWTDLPVWFLGEESVDYLIRMDTTTDFLSGAKTIEDINEFKSLLQENNKGVVVLDSWDDYVPGGVREYANDHLKKEFENDRLYTTQPRYWPVNVYSWGISSDK